MALEKANIPASNSRGQAGGRGLPGTEAPEQRLADSLAGMQCDDLRGKEHQGLKSDHPRAKSWHCPAQVVGYCISDLTQPHPKPRSSHLYNG